MTAPDTLPRDLVERVQKFVDAIPAPGLIRQEGQTLDPADIRTLLAAAAPERREPTREEMAGGEPVHFQWNPGWKIWEQVIPEPAGKDGVYAAYGLPSPPDRKGER